MDKVELTNAPSAGSSSPAATASRSSKKRATTARRGPKKRRLTARQQAAVVAAMTSPLPRTSPGTPAKYFDAISLYPARQPTGLHFDNDDDSRSKMELAASLFHRECEVAALRVSDTTSNPRTARSRLQASPPATGDV